MAYYGVTIAVDENNMKKMKNFYASKIVPCDDIYTLFMAKDDDVVIKAFSNKKSNMCKVYFTGDNALTEAQRWDKDAKLIEPVKEPSIEWLDVNAQIGSDETGVGDFLAPTVVVACYVTSKEIALLKDMGVKDSKKLNDEKIRNLAPQIMELVKYEKLIMSNRKLTNMMRSGAKKLALEALMHNECHMRLIEKYHLETTNVYVDEFLNEYNYRACLASKQMPRSLHFKTKGESYYPSVAAASVIARYILLKYVDEMSAKYGERIPLGAGRPVDVFSENFVRKHSLNELSDIAKLQFINYQQLLERLANK